MQISADWFPTNVESLYHILYKRQDRPLKLITSKRGAQGEASAVKERLCTDSSRARSWEGALLDQGEIPG